MAGSKDQSLWWAHFELGSCQGIEKQLSFTYFACAVEMFGPRTCHKQNVVQLRFCRKSCESLNSALQ